MIELIPAKKYYGKGRTGWVVLVDGNPTHFTGPTARTDAEDFADSITRKRNRATFERWLSDGQSWIGVFQNQDLGSRDIGKKIALCFDEKHFLGSAVGQTRAPDTRAGMGWRYILVAKCRTADEAEKAMLDTVSASTPQSATSTTVHKGSGS